VAGGGTTTSATPLSGVPGTTMSDRGGVPDDGSGGGAGGQARNGAGGLAFALGCTGWGGSGSDGLLLVP
jgi:hypothetical protein